MQMRAPLQAWLVALGEVGPVMVEVISLILHGGQCNGLAGSRKRITSFLVPYHPVYRPNQKIDRVDGGRSDYESAQLPCSCSSSEQQVDAGKADRQ